MKQIAVESASSRTVTEAWRVTARSDSRTQPADCEFRASSEEVTANRFALRRLTTYLARSADARRCTLLSSLARVASLSRRIGLDIELSGRIKGVDSIWEKMLSNHLGAHEILDIIGIRVITWKTPDCYRLIRCIESVFPVLKDEFDDYVVAPKSNGYRSLHTTVVSPSAFPVEIQVRTHAMHELCEQGAAAHAQYKLVRRMGLTPWSERAPVAQAFDPLGASKT